jgi:FKBP-type peptidyl-prolyl cis-trans isomerase
MKTSYIYTLALGALSLAGCAQAQQPITLPSGLQYTVHRHGNGVLAEAGDMVTVKYAGRLENGKQFDAGTIPFTLGVGQVIQGWDEGISKLKVGDSSTLFIPAKLGYGEMGAGADIPPNSNLIFEVVLLKTQKPVKHEPFNAAGRDTITRPSGLRYCVISEPQLGNIPQNGQQVGIHYAGYLVDGRKFDASYDRMEPIRFEMGRAGFIQGWLEALTFVKNGGQYKLFIPGNLAYGERGYPGVIPPNATLVFDMHVVEVGGIVAPEPAAAKPAETAKPTAEPAKPNNQSKPAAKPKGK